MNNHNDNLNNQRQLEEITSSIENSKIKTHEYNHQQTQVLSKQEDNEINKHSNCEEFSLSISSPSSSFNNSSLSDNNKQIVNRSTETLSSSLSSGNEQLALYIPEQDKDELTMDLIIQDLNYEKKANKA
jgi:hypothetical protein